MRNKLLILAFLLFYQISWAQQDFDSLYKASPEFKEQFDNFSANYDFFADTTVVKMTIAADFKEIVKKKYVDEYRDGILTYFLRDSVKVVRKIRIKPRGNMRRQVCYYPPLKIKLSKKKAILKELQEFDKLKMVVECKSGNMYEQYLLTEYLVYKMYNVLTNISFRVRLVQLKYIDTGGRHKPEYKYAFFIESLEQLNKRLNCVEILAKNVGHNLTEANISNLMDIFQYFIGNTDWSMPTTHNMKIVKDISTLDQIAYPIPYDFDYAGIINTSYAVPHESLPIKEVRERYFMGHCYPKETFDQTIAFFKEKKEELYSLVINESNGIRKKNKTFILNYMDEFYSIIDSDIRVKRELLNVCKN
ncbi:hypothetical protein R9C00_00515 [Flammeovirgaceae bacterium SG7u.111]|nr:hypothetical protein [Flammeovirgaceae bacterium SG7u.132]WPO35932.1 hypothetical protein R9C00_00515 [Flammeovirgaceae bacterium SG7u.111]